MAQPPYICFHDFEKAFDITELPVLYHGEWMERFAWWLVENWYSKKGLQSVLQHTLAPLPTTVWHPARIFFLTHLLPAGHRSNAAEIVTVQLQSNSLLGAAAHAKNSSPLTEENSRTSWLHPQLPVQNGGYWSMLKVWDSLLLCCQPTSWIPSLWTTPRSIPPLQPSDWAIFMWHSDFSAWKAMEDCYWYIRRPRECMFFITGGFQGALNPLGCHNLYEVRVLPYRDGLPLELFYCMHEVCLLAEPASLASYPGSWL